MLYEAKRKSFHVLGIFIPLSYIFVEKHYAVFLMFLVVITDYAIEILRFKVERVNQLFLRIFGDVTREWEKNSLLGATYFVTSAFLVVFFFEKPIAIASLFFLVLGDAAAAVVGKKIGTHKIFKEKTIEGSLACFLICLLVGILLLPLKVALIGSLAATLVEAVEMKIDDNLRIPLFSALAMHFVF